MSFATFPAATRTGGIVWALALAVFLTLWFIEGYRETALAVPAAIGWAAAIYALRPLVTDHKRTALYFAFAVLAFLMFFLHETYEYAGKVRNFPLIIGWAGVGLSLLDIISVTDTRMGRAIANFFGSALEETPGEGRNVSREIACVASVGGGVAMIWALGFLITSLLFVFLWMLLWGRKTVLKSALGGICTLAFVWIMFEVLLQYELHLGVLTEWVLETYFR